MWKTTLDVMVWEISNVMSWVHNHCFRKYLPSMTFFGYHGLGSHVVKYLINFLCHQNTVNKENAPHGQVIS